METSPCDLCLTDPATRAYPGGVSACAACAELLDRRDPDALVARVARERRVLTAEVLAELREVLLRVWGP